MFNYIKAGNNNNNKEEHNGGQYTNKKNKNINNGKTKWFFVAVLALSLYLEHSKKINQSADR